MLERCCDMLIRWLQVIASVWVGSDMFGGKQVSGEGNPIRSHVLQGTCWSGCGDERESPAAAGDMLNTLRKAGLS